MSKSDTVNKRIVLETINDQISKTFNDQSSLHVIYNSSAPERDSTDNAPSIKVIAYKANDLQPLQQLHNQLSKLFNNPHTPNAQSVSHISISNHEASFDVSGNLGKLAEAALKSRSEQNKNVPLTSASLLTSATSSISSQTSQRLQ